MVWGCLGFMESGLGSEAMAGRALLWFLLQYRVQICSPRFLAYRWQRLEMRRLAGFGIHPKEALLWEVYSQYTSYVRNQALR